ncbi:MAG: dihydroneopterin aldolase [Prevotella sp.]|nr:dihydroneopterin aldolase [Prevotella sp.]MDD7606651.1 dihydroneopterin aldolase [Prevotellaceae bacterium]MDY3247784.1 dihydroneopterin aldolase [Prevotella sp.]
MKLQSSYIYLRDLHFHAYHGVEPQERKVGNDYLLSLRLQYPIDAAMLSDNVLDTVNYADVYRIAEQEMQVPSNLLERVAYRMADRIFRRFAFVEAVDIQLTKLNPPMGTNQGGAGVEVHLINDKT